MVTTALIKICATNNINLTLMHYNTATANYVPQVIFGKEDLKNMFLALTNVKDVLIDDDTEYDRIVSGKDIFVIKVVEKIPISFEKSYNTNYVLLYGNFINAFESCYKIQKH